MNNIQISVIITCYNRVAFIKDAIDSVLKSTFTDFELIIVDDNSTDGSKDIIAEYEKVDERIKVYFNASNLGQFKNRNYAASLATGKYIKYLDSDDLIYEHGLELFYRYAINYPNVAAVVCSDLLHDVKPYPIVFTPYVSYKKFFIDTGFPTVGPSAILFNKKCFDEVNGFPQDAYVGSDIELLLNLCTKNNILVIHSGLIWYRKHEGQALNIGIKNNEYVLNNFNRLLNFLKISECPLTLEDRKYAICLFLKSELKLILKMILNLKLSLAFNLLKSFIKNYFTLQII